MPFTAVLLLAALPAAPPAAPAPHFEPGDELTYTGTVAEAVDRVDNRFRRRHAVEVRVFVLEKRPGSFDAAVLTQLRRTDDGAVPDAVAPAAKAPPATRLDLVRVSDSTVTWLAPKSGPGGLVLTPDTPSRPLPPVPLDAFAPFEFGPLPPRPAAPLAPGQVGNRADPDPARPPVSCRAADPEFVAGELCVPLVQIQQSAGWNLPNAGPVAWERAETAWLSARDGVARQVRRVVRQRAGTDPNPTVTVETRYELTDRTRLIGRAHDRARREVEAAVSAAAELSALAADPAKNGKALDALARRLDAHAAENPADSPYREAVLAVRRRVEAARRGEAPPVTAVSASIPAPVAAPDQPAPDFLAAGADGGAKVRLQELKGRPVVLVFFRPGAGSAPACLVTADALHRRYGGKVVVLPLAAGGPAADAAKLRTALAVSVPVYDGADAAAKYGVTSYPRFAVVGAGGTLAWEFAGYGNELGSALNAAVARALNPAAPRTGGGAEGVTFDPTPPAPDPPAGTVAPPGPPMPGPTPPP